MSREGKGSGKGRGKGKGKSYEVGYGKPPKASRFKPGKSGNPKGRPKEDKDWRDIARDVFFKKIPIRVNGKTKKVPAVEAHLIQIRQKSLEGDAKSSNQVIRLLPLLQTIDSKSDAGEGLTQEQRTALDQHILAEFWSQHRDVKREPRPRTRKRKKPEDEQ